MKKGFSSQLFRCQNEAYFILLLFVTVTLIFVQGIVFSLQLVDSFVSCAGVDPYGHF